MAGKLLLPPVVEDVAGPLVFLAGPVQGAPDWQAQAIAVLGKAAPEIHIASPRRDYLPGEFSLEEQVDWETRYLRLAALRGAIMFWLAREVEHFCDRAYAQTSRFELAEWKVHHQRTGASIVVGIEEGFTNARYIRRRLAQDCPDLRICSSLTETCEQVLAVINASKRNA